MVKTAAQLQDSKAGSTTETNGLGGQEKPLRQSGLYQLKNEAGEVVSTIIVRTHPLFGDGQASAAERVGFRYVRAATKDDIKEITMDLSKTDTGSGEELKGIQARMTAFEEESKALRAENTALKEAQVTQTAKPSTK
jgi:hypothetical protein